MLTLVPNSKVHRANLGPIWGRQDPGGPMLAHELCYLGYDPDVTSIFIVA